VARESSEIREAQLEIVLDCSVTIKATSDSEAMNALILIFGDGAA